MITRSHRNTGFTLIELLVVISIIALLIGILLPALAAARQAARTMQGLSQQRQIGIGAVAYATDNDEFYVRYRTDWTGTFDSGAQVPGESWWTGTLSVGKYTPGIDIYLDPSFEVGANAAARSGGQLNLDDFDDTNPGAAEWTATNYGLNSSNIGSRQRESGFNAAIYQAKPVKTPRLSEIRNPTNMYMLMDAATVEGSLLEPTVIAGCMFVWDSSQRILNSGSLGRPHARHANNGINITYADGHASTMSVQVSSVGNSLGNPTMVGFYSVGGSLDTASEDGSDPNPWTIDGKPGPGF